MTKYVVVGDSQAEGLLFSVALPSLLGEDLVGEYDRRGWSTARMLSDGVLATAAGRAAVEDATLLVFLGGNDLNVLSSAAAQNAYRNVLLDAVKAIARKSAATGKTINVVWFGPVFSLVASSAEQHRQAQQVQRQVLTSGLAVQLAVGSSPGARVNLRWVDSFPLTSDLANPSNVHLTAANYRVFAERVMHAAAGGGVGKLMLTALAAAGGYWAWRKWGPR